MKPKYLFSAIMFTYFAASAILFPLFTLYLSRSFTPDQIGILMAIVPVSMIFFQPIWGKIASRFEIQPILVLNLSLAAVSAVGLIFVKTFIEYFIVLSIYSVFVVSILPLIDALVLSTDSKHYGNIRLWGSIGYGLAVFFNGTFKSNLLGFWSFILHICFLIITIIFVLNIPRVPLSKVTRNNKRDSSGKKPSPFLNKQFLVMVTASLMLGITTKAYDSFFPIGLTALHASDLLLGSSWIIEIIPEVIIFIILDKLDSKVPSKIIMVTGIFIWALRMAILSIFPVLWVWISTQPLNSLAFCFWYFGTNKTLNTTLTSDQRIQGISIFWAITYGVGGVVGSLISGFIVNKFGIPILFGFISACCFIAFLLCSQAVVKRQLNLDQTV